MKTIKDLDEGLKRIEETVFKEFDRFTSIVNEDGTKEISLLRSDLAMKTMARLVLTLQLANLSFNKKIKKKDYKTTMTKIWKQLIKDTVGSCQSVIDKDIKDVDE